MNPEVSDYINTLNDKPGQAWQVEVCTRLREIALASIPDVTERIQYGKPHFLKAGKYAAVISTSKGAVSFMIFKAEALEVPEGFFEPGKTTVKILEGQAVDYELLARLLQEAANSVA